MKKEIQDEILSKIGNGGMEFDEVLYFKDDDEFFRFFEPKKDLYGEILMIENNDPARMYNELWIRGKDKLVRCLITVPSSRFYTQCGLKDFPEVQKRIRERMSKNPYRQQSLTVTQSELEEYRKAQTINEIGQLDRLFFQRHQTAEAFKRPLFMQEAKDMPDKPVSNFSGIVWVFWLSDSERYRVIVPDASLC